MRSDLVLKKIFNDKLHFMTRRHRLKQIMPKDYLRRLEDKQPNNFFNKNYWKVRKMELTTTNPDIKLCHCYLKFEV